MVAVRCQRVIIVEFCLIAPQCNRSSSDLVLKLYPVQTSHMYLARITNLIARRLIFPFISSVFYVFYDQYLTIWHDLILNLALSFTAVFLVTCVLLGFDFHTSFLIMVCLLMIIVDMFGVMYLWNIQLNAVTVVNIVMVKSRRTFPILGIDHSSLPLLF